MAKFSGFRYARNQRSRRLKGVWLIPDNRYPVETLTNQSTNVTVVWGNINANSTITFTSTGLLTSLPNYNIGNKTSGNVKLSTSLPAGTNTYEGPRYFTINAFISNALVHSTNINLLDAAPTFTITTDTGWVISEGDTVRFFISSTNVPNNTVYYWTVGGTSSASDIVGGITSGSLNIFNNQADVIFTITNDLITDNPDFISTPPETLVLNIRSASIFGPIVATANTVYINDTSLTQATLTSVSPVIVAGPQTSTFTLTGTAFDLSPNVYVRATGNVNYLANNIVRNTSSNVSFRFPKNFSTAESPLSVWMVQPSNAMLLNNVITISAATLTSVSPGTYSGLQNSSFSLTGTNFDTAPQVYLRTNANVNYLVSNIVRNSITNITFTSPRNFTVAEGPLSVWLIQPSNSVILANVIIAGSVPVWTTASGNIGPVMYDSVDTRSYTTTVVATDPDGGAITYSFVGTGYPVNTSLNASTGVISNGYIDKVATTTIYGFTVRATDQAGNFTDRQFSIAVLAQVALVYSYTGGDQSFTVPSGLERVTFKLWGAGGTASQSLTFAPIPVGGDGGFAQSTIATTAGTTYTLIVGQSTYNRNGGLNYGGGRSGQNDGGYGGGDGGGRSAVRLSSGTEILTAGGGGGGGMYWMTGPFPWASPGGVGGGLVGGGGGGYAWTAAGDGRTAGGGTQTAGGLGARHQGPPPNTGNANDYTLRFAPGNGSQFAGGPVATSFSGGAGGGGYYGGGGGTGERLQDSGTRWGGGGGSGWAGRNGASTLPGTDYGSVGSPEDTGGRTDTVTNVTYYNTVVIQGRNSSDAYYGNNAGLGINVYNNPASVGGHGRIVIIY